MRFWENESVWVLHFLRMILFKIHGCKSAACEVASLPTMMNLFHRRRCAPCWLYQRFISICAMNMCSYATIIQMNVVEKHICLERRRFTSRYRNIHPKFIDLFLSETLWDRSWIALCIMASGWYPWKTLRCGYEISVLCVGIKFTYPFTHEWLTFTRLPIVVFGHRQVCLR